MMTKTIVLRAYAPVEGAALVEDQIRLAHRYKNKLIEIERARRAAVQAARDAAGDLAALVERRAITVEEIARVKAEIKTARKAAKARLPLPAGKRTTAVREAHAREQTDKRAAAEARGVELARELEAARAAYASAKAALAETRYAQAASPEVVRATEAAGAVAAESVRAARAACGLYWGTYLRVEAAVQQAANAKPRPAPGKPPTPWHLRPHFVRARGDGGGAIEGEIAVQCQVTHSLTVADAWACRDTRVRLEPLVPAPTDGSRRHDVAEGLGVTRLWLRVGSDGRAPLWAVFPLRATQRLPQDGRITWAVVQRRLVGTHWRWHAHLTIESADAAHIDVSSLPDVAVNFGWRQIAADVEPGIRVAYALGRDNWTRELRVPEDLVEKLAHARSVLAIRRRAYDAFLPRAAALAEALRCDAHPPEWWSRDAETLALWKSPERLWRFVARWRVERFDGDCEAFDRREAWNAWHRDGRRGARPDPTTFDEWAHTDRHLGEWGRHEEAKCLARRDDIYRVWAAEVARHAGRVFIDDTDYRVIIARTAAGEAGGAAERASPRRHLAAPGRARQFLANACSGIGRQVVEVAPERKTIECSRCGAVEPWDAARDLRHECPRCAATWDQDWNFCRNALAAASGSVTPDGPGSLAGSNGAVSRAKSAVQVRRESGKARKQADRSREDLKGREDVGDS